MDGEREAIKQIKELCEYVDGWEDGETFYKGTIQSIRDILASIPSAQPSNDIWVRAKVTGATQELTYVGGLPSAQPQDFVAKIAQQRANMKEALCEFAIANGANFNEVTLVEKEAHEGNNLRWEYSIQKTEPMVIPSAQPSDVVEEELANIINRFRNHYMPDYNTPRNLAKYIIEQCPAALTTQQTQSGDVEKLVKVAEKVSLFLDGAGYDCTDIELALQPFTQNKGD